jgi:hypothetical protein
MPIVSSSSRIAVGGRVTAARGSALVNLQELVRHSAMRSCSSFGKALVRRGILLIMSISTNGNSKRLQRN